MIAQMVLALMGITLAQSSTPSNCDGKHAKLHTAWPFNNKPITSPNYPLPYGRVWGDCLWLIESSYFGDHNFILKVVFNDFELEEPTSSGCWNVNNLKFYDGPSSKSNLLGIYCGTAHPDVIYSTGQYLRVQLYGYRAKYRGFSFNVSVVKKEEASAICRVPSLDSNVTSLNGSSGTFFSPNFPAPYPDGAFCIWAIAVSVGKIVKLTFENFTIAKQSSWECSYVEIRDSLSSNGTELARSNCDVYTPYFPSVVYSTGRYMWVKFLSNIGPFHRKKEDRGFKVHFKAVDPIVDKELCLPGNPYNNFLSLTSDKGTLMTPMKYYPPNLSCKWFITVPEGNTVWVTIKRFNMGRLSSCGDYIEFLDGSHNRIEKLCGYDSPPDVIRSSSRYMIVMFRSDGNYYDRFEGFEATFKAVREDPASDEDDGDSDLKWKMGFIIGVVSVAVLFCIICIVRKRRPANSANTDANIPMTAFHDTQLPPSPPEYPYPPYSPPPYPDPEGGGEETPQYPPPGESYPWLQKNDSAHPSV